MTPPESADATAAALDRLEDLHLCDSHDYRTPPEFCVEDGQSWPCDTTLAVNLARTAEAAWREERATFERLRNACETRQYALDDARRLRARVAALEAAAATAVPEDGAGEGG